MAKLPTLLPLNPRRPGKLPTDSVVLAVFAPFGSDKLLSNWPLDEAAATPPITKQAIVESLKKVAREGVHVCALVDLVDDFSWYVEIPAKAPGKAVAIPVWKQDMSDPHSLAGFLIHVQRRFPCSDVVLALEGHGAGYIPEIDASKLTIENITDGGNFSWRKEEGGTRVEPGSLPPLTMVSPELTMVSPELPATRMPMSTPGMARALRLAQKYGARRPAVIHFDNCFNLSVELLHTVAPHADYATAYANYNFFTAGQAYATVFANLRMVGSASREQLARWFAEANRDTLDNQPIPHYPTMGGMVRLAGMAALAKRVDKLAEALVKAMSEVAPPQRDDVVKAIRQAILDAQQYDTDQDQHLDVPDQLTDLRAFAEQLTRQPFANPDVIPAATDLAAALAGIRVYGKKDHPITKPSELWDFRDPPLAINILLPDPERSGVWDWRSPYYLRSRFDPSKPSALAVDIGFLAKGKWVDFIIEYHKGVPFGRYLPARKPLFPVVQVRKVPSDDQPPKPGKRGR